MAELDGLARNMEKLCQYLEMKREVLRKECQELQALLSPWNVQQKSTKINGGSGDAEMPNGITTNLADDAMSSSHDELIVEELQKADKLLEKVQRVRNTVKDEEIRDVCKIKAKTLSERVNKPGDTNISTQAKRQTNGIRERPSANKYRLKQTATVNQTSYQKSYQAPRLSQPIISSNYGGKNSKKEITKADSSGTISSTANTGKRLKLASVPTSNSTVKDSARVNDDSKNIEVIGDGRVGKLEQASDGGAAEVIFSLQTHGKELKIPRSLRFHIKLNKDLQDRIQACASNQSLISDRLNNYFQSVEDNS